MIHDALEELLLDKALEGMPGSVKPGSAALSGPLVVESFTNPLTPKGPAFIEYFSQIDVSTLETLASMSLNDWDWKCLQHIDSSNTRDPFSLFIYCCPHGNQEFRRADFHKSHVN